MGDIRKFIESVRPLFDDRVESDTDRYYADQERRERQAEANLPYDIESAETYFRTSPEGMASYKDAFLDNLVNDPQEGDIELVFDIIEHYFDNVVKQSGWSEKFLDSETMDQLVVSYLRDEGYNIDISELDKYRN